MNDSHSTWTVHVTVVVTCSLEYDVCGLGLLSIRVLSTEHEAFSDEVLAEVSVEICKE